MPCAWPVTEDMKRPTTGRSPSTRPATSATSWPSSWPTAATQAADAVDAVVVDYDPLPAVVDLEDAAERPGRHPRRPRHQPQLHVGAVPDDDAVDGAFADAAHTVSERYVQQRLIPMAMEPRGVAVVPGVYGGDITVYSATQIPHILKMMIGATCGVPEQKVRVIAPSVGGGVRLQAQRLRRGADRRRRRPAPGRAGPVDRGPHRERGGHHPGPGPDPAHRAGRRRRRQGHGGAGQAARRHGRLPPAGHAGHPAARGVPLPRRLRRPGLLLRVHRRVHQPDAHRRLPGRRAARGHLRHRAGDGRAGPGGRRRPAEIRRRNYIPPDQFPYDVGRRARPSTRATTSRRSTGRSSWSATTTSGPSSSAGATPATPSTSASASPPTSRCAASPRAGCWPRSTTRAGGWEAATVRRAAHRQGPGGHRGHAARPGPRDVLVADRGRQAGRRPRRRRGAALRHRHQPASAWTPTAAGRCRSAGVAVAMAADQVIDKARSHRRPPARGAEDDLEFVDGELPVRGTPGQGDAAPGRRVRGVHRPRPARRHGAQPRGPGHLRPAQLRVPVRDPRGGGRGRRGDRAGSSCATTWRSTTAATRSTR